MGSFDEFKNKASWYFTVIGLATVIIGGTFFAIPIFQRRAALRAQEQELVERIAAKQAEIKLLKENQLRFRNDTDFVEQIARQNRRLYPGELMFIFDTEK